MESPWASFSDVLSGMLFVFVITTFWFAMQLAQARMQTEQEQVRAVLEKEKYTKKQELEAELVDGDRPDSITRCLTLTEGGPPTLQADADLVEARVSLYLVESVENVAWFGTNQTTFEDPVRAQAAVKRVSQCIEQLLDRRELEPYRLRMYVEGHTDAVPVGKLTTGADATTNWELSGERAARVLRTVREASAKISTAQDRGDLELIAVGWAELKPAQRRICDEANDDEIDRAVCDASAAARRGVLLQRAPEFRDVNLGCRAAPIPGDLSESELLRRWANRCVDELGVGDRTRRRLAMLRRVDLRVELLPRVSG